MSEETSIPEEVKSTEVVSFTQEIGELNFSSDKEVDNFIERVERRNIAIEKIMNAAIRRLMPKDFIDMDGKPYFQGQGAERLKKYFGIQVFDVERIPAVGYEVVKEDTVFRLRVTYRANYRLGNMVQVGMGIWDTHKKLIGKKGGEYKELADISLPDLDASARTKMDQDGISRLLGLRGLTWEYLKELGFTPDKTTRITYGKGTEGGNVSGGNSDAQQQQSEILGMLLEMSGGDKNLAGEMLVNFTKSADGKYKGYKDVTKLSPKQLEFIHPKIKKDYDVFIEKHAGTGVVDIEDGKEGELGF